MPIFELEEIDNELRDYQKLGKRNIYSAWKKNRAVLFQMPTGTGKTRLFSSIIKDTQRLACADHKRRGVLVLAHRTELIEQIDQTLSMKYGVAHGIIKSGYEEMMHFPVQVASVQTIVRRLDRWVDKGFSYIIIDEAHHAVSSTYMKICKAFPDAKILGVTATPCRLSGDALRRLFSELVLSQPVNKFIEQGYLSPYNYYSIKPESNIQRQLDGITNFNVEGDYADSDMMRICDTNKVRANIIKAYLKYAKGKKGIIYTINQEHNKHICEEFSKIGVKIKAIDSKTSSEERKKTVSDFRAGRIDMICNVNIFSEGFDCPDCEFIQLARPTCSLSMYLQQVGRGLRTHKSKIKAVILDNVGSYNKFGLPSANRKWKAHFYGFGQRVTESQVVSANEGVGRKRKKVEEGDEDMIMIYGGETPNVASVPASEPIPSDSILESIVSTKSWFPFGALSMINAASYSSQSVFQELCSIVLKYDSEEEWTTSVDEELGYEFYDNEEEYAKLEKRISNIYKFNHRGKCGVCELHYSGSALQKACNAIVAGNMSENEVYSMILPPEYDEIRHPDTSDRYISKKDGKYGVVSGMRGKILVPFEYDDIELQLDGMYLVKKENKIGLIDGTDIIIPFEHKGIEYVQVHPIASSIRYYAVYDGKYYSLECFESSQHLGNESTVKACQHLVDNYYLGVTQKNHGFICDSCGRILFPKVFTKIGLLQVKDKWEVVITADDLNVYLLDKKFNVIKKLDDCSGKPKKFCKKFHLDQVYIVTQNDVEVRSFNQEPQVKPITKKNPMFQSDDGLWGYAIGEEILLEPIYQAITEYKQGRLIVTLNGKKGVYAIIDRKAKLIIPIIFDQIEGTGKQLKYKINQGEAIEEKILSGAKFQLGNLLVYKDYLGEEYLMNHKRVLTSYKEINHLSNGVFVVRTYSGFYGIISYDDKRGLMVHREPKYKRIEVAKDNDSILLYKDDGKRPRFVTLHSLCAK